MDKIKYEILLSSGKKEEVEGFAAKIQTPGDLKFGVAETGDGEWRTTELSTGWAVPKSMAYTAEESVKNAQAAIDEVNAKQTYVQGVVKGVRGCLEAFNLVQPANGNGD